MQRRIQNAQSATPPASNASKTCFADHLSSDNVDMGKERPVFRAVWANDKPTCKVLVNSTDTTS